MVVVALGRRVLVPQLLDDPIDADDAVRLEGEQGENSAKFGCGWCDIHAGAGDLEWSEYGDFHEYP